jgi:hypothetical protein
MRLLAGLFAVSACTSTASPPTPTASAESTAVGRACGERVAAMRAGFAGMTKLRRTIDLPDGMQLPASDHGTAMGDATFLLFVRADGTFVLDGEPVATVEAVTRPLLAELARLNEEWEPAPPIAPQATSKFALVIFLALDARAPLTPVVALVEALPKETNFWQVVDLADAPEGPAGPAWVDETLAAIRTLPPPERSMEVARAIERAIGGCASLQDDFDLIATGDPEQRGVLLAHTLPLSVERCRCEGVDVEGLTTIVWATAGGEWVRKRQLPLAFSRDEAASAVILPVNANGADLAREAAVRGLRPFRLQLDDP